MTYVFSSPSRQAALIQELNKWVGTPWAHRANVPGQQRAVRQEGGDCVTIPLTALYNLSILSPLQLPAHVVAPGLCRDDEVMDSITKFVKPYLTEGLLCEVNYKRQPLLCGDFLAFKFRAARAHHLGLFAGGADNLFYHAPGPGTVYTRESLNPIRAYMTSVYRLIEAVPGGASVPACAASVADASYSSVRKVLS